MRTTLVLNKLPFPSSLEVHPPLSGGTEGGTGGWGDGVENRLAALLALTVLLATAACRQQQINSADIQLELKASGRQIGETTLLASVKDGDGNAIANPGTLSVRGDMSHAGMIPVFAQADAASDGVFTLPFEWTMAGSWIVEASLTLEDGDTATETFTFEIHAPADEDAMASMEHRKMQGARGEVSADETADMDRSGIDATPGEASAVYMRISNRGATDHIIVSAHSAAAERIDFHRTIIEDDIARMEALDALIIPAGETLELRPGGAHIMLSALTDDLTPDSAFSLQLRSSAGEVYDLEVSVLNMLMGELDDTISHGDLVFSSRWARPARAGAMAHADMPMTSE